jgi:HK97 gp10 family phage protein
VIEVRDVRFAINPTFERDVLARNPDLVMLLKTKTEQIAARARDKAPERTGNLRDSIKADVGVAVVLGSARTIGRVRADDFKAHWHEFGTRKMHAHPFLFPALAETVPNARKGGGGAD